MAAQASDGWEIGANSVAMPAADRVDKPPTVLPIEPERPIDDATVMRFEGDEEVRYIEFEIQVIEGQEVKVFKLEEGTEKFTTFALLAEGGCVQITEAGYFIMPLLRPTSPPPPPRHLVSEFGICGAEAEPLWYSPWPYSSVQLHPDSHAHGDVYRPHGANFPPIPPPPFWPPHLPWPYPWPGDVVGRADTEAEPIDTDGDGDVDYDDTTRVQVCTRLWRLGWDGWWRLRASTFRWTETRCPHEGDYDIDAYAGAPWLGPGLYCTASTHWVFRDGVRTGRATQVTAATFVPDRWVP